MAEVGELEHERGYEATDVQLRWPLLVAVILVIGLAATLFCGHALLQALFKERSMPRATQLDRTAIVPPLPHLERTPRETLTAVRSREEQLLETFGWVDRSRGLARIPIEDAMRVMAQRGWPAPEAGTQSKGRQ
jgi:hypothetical protein